VVAAVPVNHEIECLVRDAHDDLVDQGSDNALARGWRRGSSRTCTARSAVRRSTCCGNSSVGIVAVIFQNVLSRDSLITQQFAISGSVSN
jgi:hypothetical protein